MSNQDTVHELVASISTGHRRSLAIALSLIESSRDEDKELSLSLRELAVQKTSKSNARRIAISGAPGVGKSSILESLGLQLVANGHTVAVLTVDPSSQRTGGSILADKLRMPKLSANDKAFIRPSASRLSIGGVTDTTRDAITLCELAGYDTIIVETVGVGQNEIAASQMVDLFVLLTLATAGDEMQGIKRGIMEVCDVLVITKRDLDVQATHRAAAVFRNALHLMASHRPDWAPIVVTASAVQEDGSVELINAIDSYFDVQRWPSILEVRQQQREQWFDETVQSTLLGILNTNTTIRLAIDQLRRSVLGGVTHPQQAIQELLSRVQISM